MKPPMKPAQSPAVVFPRRASRARAVALVGSGLTCFGLAGCMWDRFDQAGTDPPVELLESPEEIEVGFGATLAALSSVDDTTLVFVGGEPGSTGGASYNAGLDENPRLEPLSSSYCERSSSTEICALAMHAAALARAATGGAPGRDCFVSGAGVIGTREGLIGRCADGFQYALPVPDSVRETLIEPILAGTSEPEFTLGADGASEPALVAGVPAAARAFYYRPNSTTPIELTPSGEAPEDFGRSVTVLRVGDDRLLAVGAAEAGQVWIFRDSAEEPELLGCIGGPARLGRAMTSGDVTDDGVDDLVVSGAESVLVFSGAGLSLLTPTSVAECSFVSLPADTLVGSLVCGSGPETSGCETSEFGAALAVANVDGSGAGEIAVGAPAMTVRGATEAGAVLVYGGSFDLVDTRILSNASAGDRFGAAVTRVPQTDRDVLLVGAPRASKAALVYCFASLESGTSPRCE